LLDRILVLAATAALVSGCAVNLMREALTRAMNLNGHTLYGEYEEANWSASSSRTSSTWGSTIGSPRNALRT